MGTQGELRREQAAKLSIESPKYEEKKGLANDWMHERKVYQEKLIETLQKQELNQQKFICQTKKQEDLIGKMRNSRSYFDRMKDEEEREDRLKNEKVKSIYMNGLKNQMAMNDKLRKDYENSRERNREKLVKEILSEKKEENDLKVRQLKIKNHYRNLLKQQVWD